MLAPRLFSLGSGLTPCSGSLFQVLRQPSQECLIPEFAILRFQDPVPFIGEYYEFRWNSLTLQRREEFQVLRVRHAEIEFPVNDERRRAVLAKFRRIGRG